MTGLCSLGMSEQQVMFTHLSMGECGGRAGRAGRQPLYTAERGRPRHGMGGIQ